MASRGQLRWANLALGAGVAIFLLSMVLTDRQQSDGERTTVLSPPRMPVPADNPQTAAKVALGRHLFYDTRLSFNQTVACASCHQQDKAFTDGRRLSPGATGELTRRNAMSLTNVGHNAALTWADNTVTSLEQQALIPLTATHPLEMGIAGHEREVLARLQENPRYRKLFSAAWPEEANPFTLHRVTQALGAFQRTLLSYDSPYDRYLKGDKSAVDAQVLAGRDIFFSREARCSRCHGGHNFRFTLGHRRSDSDQSVAFHNTGLYNLNDRGAYPLNDRGLIDVTDQAGDMGKFKTPSLRNIALTAPYMHDGSMRTLEEVIAHYARGGRLIEKGENAGDGRQNPHKSDLITGFEISADEEAALIAFLHSLTDDTFLQNAGLSDPWQDHPAP